MENPRDKQFSSFKLCATPSSVTKSHRVLLHPAWDVSQPFARSVHARHVTRLLVTYSHLGFQADTACAPTVPG